MGSTVVPKRAEGAHLCCRYRISGQHGTDTTDGIWGLADLEEEHLCATDLRFWDKDYPGYMHGHLFGF